MKFAGIRLRAGILFSLVAACLIATGAASSESASAAETYDLRPQRRPGELTRTDVLVELKGDLKIKPTPESETTTKPFQVSITLRYDERVLEATPDGRVLRSLRYYTVAQGEYRYDDLTAKPSVTTFQPDWLLFDREAEYPLVCPRRLVFRHEMEMLDVPGNSAFLDDLLPTKPVEADATWSPEDDILTKLLVIDAVNDDDVATRIDSVDGDKVSLITEGDVAGAASGVTSDVKIRARMGYSLKDRRIQTFAMTWREIRSIGHAEPGFDVVATVRMATSPIAESASLDDARIKSLPRKYRMEMGLLKYESPQKDFRFVQDRRWRSLPADEQGTVLRFIDRGDLIAQCSVVRLPRLQEGEEYTLDMYKAEIQGKLGESFSRFVDTREFETKQGARAMKLFVDGRAEDLEMRWVYYHLANPDGRRISLVFVYEPQFEETFGDADRWIVENFEFLPIAEEAQEQKDASASVAPAAELQPDATRR